MKFLKFKARNNFGVSTTPEIFEKKLLRGEMFEDVEKIGEAGLLELYDICKSEVTGIEYRSAIAEAPPVNKPGERDMLLNEKHRTERALNRLKTLYLYSEEKMAEKEYVLEKSKLDESLETINRKLDELGADLSEEFSLSDEDFFAKATYFLLTQNLTEQRFVNYGRLLEIGDPRIIKEFLNSVVTNFCIKDGKIYQITFKNCISHEFIYKS